MRMKKIMKIMQMKVKIMNKHKKEKKDEKFKNQLFNFIYYILLFLKINLFYLTYINF